MLCTRSKYKNVTYSSDSVPNRVGLKVIELGGSINENGWWVLLRMNNHFTLLAFNLLNCDAELMQTIASCRSGNTISRAVPLSKKNLHHSQFSDLFKWNKYFQVFVGTAFLIHLTAQKNKLNMWYRKQAMQILTKRQMNWFGKL